VGRGSKYFSLVCHYRVEEEPPLFPGNPGDLTSMEWPILALGSGPFSDTGDSGALVVDVNDHAGSLTTGCSDDQSRVDITYATPVASLLRRMTRCRAHQYNLVLGREVPELAVAE
jgi:hypothetical protein